MAAWSVRAIRDHRRRRHGRRRYVTMADGTRVRASGLYWSVFWYFNVGPAWTRRPKKRMTP